MNLFDVYSLWNIEPVRAKGCRVWDRDGVEYLDFYGGHAVISIGHSHPVYVKAIQDQAVKIGFYSNSVINSLQTELAEKLGEQSGYPDYSLFLCNSGAEANENALKLASFHTGKKRIIAFSGSFHGRTSGAVAITDNPSIQSPFNTGHEVTFVPLNDTDKILRELEKGDVAAVIAEGIQGVAGIFVPENGFMQQLEKACHKHRVVLILDEIQSGYGRTGRFFAHQHAGIRPDIITLAKGMGNGFPIGGMLISPEFKAKKGMLGTTFGGNHLACAAAIAVLDVMKGEALVENASQAGNYLQDELSKLNGIKEIRGRGLMLGIDPAPEYSDIRDKLLFKSHIFTGGAKNNVMRLLPPLSVKKEEIDIFLKETKKLLEV
ncbi:MAG: aspartate aminotransferase family protein [Petrimonas sp.]|jgi:acetylornithine aminotransferase|uniref:aspartate aminotransferase family protein n=1 Tax=Petrimonas TaxID=307628 RepID=UPI000E95C0F6|nr:aspartate aminotransferase family protein [Petrimonas sp.]BBD46628.1 aminotransferase class-iii [Petrimonas sp. IBARAKI]HBQ57329.1 aspartate aminotransferase family protein [Porphyromonadaceae bacterium]MDD4845996.1 aspartate aminotransferase family protein [Petrimonas sp.]MDX9775369.1 aspartate aminotransferase family protein [Petrimonas sp.]